jgi:ABC-type cobalamin/Fe3+-siderophores transport system ATPase subunit
MTQPVPLLSLRTVTRRFPGTESAAVDALSIEVPRGTILALLGPSGCGKTTTLRLVAGFETPDAGEIVIDGVSMHVKLRVAARMACCGSVRAARIAGSEPTKSEVTAVRTTPHSKTPASMPINSWRGTVGGRKLKRRGRPIHAAVIPPNPPSSAKRVLSTSMLRTRRPELAPSAARTASSRRRFQPRAVRMLAMFTVATMRTRATDPSKNQSVVFTPLTSESRRLETSTPVSPCGSRFSATRLACTTANRSSAARSDRPSSTRPITDTFFHPYLASSVSGVQSSGGPPGSMRSHTSPGPWGP